MAQDGHCQEGHSTPPKAMRALPESNLKLIPIPFLRRETNGCTPPPCPSPTRVCVHEYQHNRDKDRINTDASTLERLIFAVAGRQRALAAAAPETSPPPLPPPPALTGELKDQPKDSSKTTFVAAASAMPGGVDVSQATRTPSAGSGL